VFWIFLKFSLNGCHVWKLFIKAVFSKIAYGFSDVVFSSIVAVFVAFAGFLAAFVVAVAPKIHTHIFIVDKFPAGRQRIFHSFLFHTLGLNGQGKCDELEGNRAHFWPGFQCGGKRDGQKDLRSVPIRSAPGRFSTPGALYSAQENRRISFSIFCFYFYLFCCFFSGFCSDGTLMNWRMIAGECRSGRIFRLGSARLGSFVLFNRKINKSEGSAERDTARYREIDMHLAMPDWLAPFP